MIEFYPAIILGLLGSMHCAGMCGPIAIAVPLNNTSWFTRISGGLVYNIGRIITYGILGLIFGFAGKGLSMGGLQQWASVGIGVIMIISVLLPLAGNAGKKVREFTDKFTFRLKKSFGKLLSVRTYSSLFTIGLLNGFLPCGLVYIALAGAILMTGPQNGALYMVIFGLGTIPVMLGIALAGNLISLKFRRKANRIIPYFIVLLGLLFILRGLNLGIPYVSPKIIKTSETVTMDCCHKKN
jgi:uncharacterized protein